MRFLSLFLIAVLTVAGASAAETLKELQDALDIQNGMLTKAQSSLRNAEASLKSNTEALARTKLPNDQKMIRGHIAVSQGIVTKERTTVIGIQREVEKLNLRIVAITQAEAKPEVKVNAAEQVAAAPVKPVKAAFTTLVMKDGSRIECVRYMEVDHEYALQLPDKKFKNVQKAEVVEIIAP